MARKTTALVPQKVSVGEFDDDADATTTAMRVLQAENARQCDQIQQLHLMLTRMHSDTIDDRQRTRQIMLDFEKAHIDAIKLREDLLDRKEERRAKRDQEKQQEKILQDGFALLKGYAPELVAALRRRKGGEPEKLTLDMLRQIAVQMPREERAAMLEILLASLEPAETEQTTEEPNGH